MRANRLLLPMLALSALPGCYLLASSEIKETCEDLPGGCAGGGDSPAEDLDGDGISAADGDCDDDEASTYPAAPDSVGDGVDNDCDGIDGVDNDGDLFASVDSGGEDCDDASAEVSPAATELCDSSGVDEDCDGLVDDDDPGVEGGAPSYADSDGDGYGDPYTEALSCAPPAGFVDRAGDCDDSRGWVSPDQPEVCGDGVDNDCDGYGGCRPIDGERSVYATDGTIGSTAAEDGYTLSAAAIGSGALLAVGGPTADDYVGGTAVFSFTGGDGGAIVPELVGLVKGGTYGNVGASVLLAPVLRGGGLALVTLGSDGTLAVFDPGSLRGTSPLTVADALATGAELYPGSAYEGRALDSGDLTGDGVAELIVGAAGSYGDGYYGAAYAFRGGGSASYSTSGGYAAVLGTLSGSYSFGYAVKLADLDADGLPDLAVGDPWAYLESAPSGGGLVAIFGGDGLRGVIDANDADAIVLSTASAQYAGWDLNAFDFDGDGRNELGVVAPGQGEALVFGDLRRGVIDTTEAIATFSFGAYYGSLGMSAGDLDADGYIDLLLPGMYDAEGAQAGSLRAVYGPLPWGWTDVTSVPDVIYGDPAGRLFGYRTEISDLDGDGGLDIVARADDGLRLFRGGGF